MVIVSAAIHLSGVWTRHCDAPWVGKLDCDLVGIALVVAIGASLFVLIILGWWLLTGLDGLKRIFEISWPGLDGGDVDTVGTIESIVRAGAWIVTILASLFVVAAALMAAFDFKRLRLADADPPRQQSFILVEPEFSAADIAESPPLDRVARRGQAHSATGADSEAHP